MQAPYPTVQSTPGTAYFVEVGPVSVEPFYLDVLALAFALDEIRRHPGDYPTFGPTSPMDAVRVQALAELAHELKAADRRRLAPERRECPAAGRRASHRRGRPVRRPQGRCAVAQERRS
jgi:hypothetical protein